MSENKITNYTVLMGQGLTQICKLVNEHIRLGWEPQGSISTVFDHGGGGDDWHYQPMIKRSKKL